MTQHEVYQYMLKQEGWISSVDICKDLVKKLDIHKGAITTSLSKLSQFGFIERKIHNKKNTYKYRILQKKILNNSNF